jgi:quercetin dioxygenase-like cupin family protein
MTGPRRGHFVDAGEGERLTYEGTDRRIKLSGATSEGHLTVYESAYAAGVAHPLHIHHDASESFFLLEGTCRFHVGDEVIVAGPGSFLSVPRGATHGLVPVGGPARALVMFAPAAMEGFWEEIAEAAAAGTLDDARLERLQHAHRVEIVGPWPEDGYGGSRGGRS